MPTRSPAVWEFAVGMVVFGLGYGAIDSALNAHAARHFSARDITWMHASYGLGATIGPLLVTGLASGGLTWRWAYGILAVTQAALACVYAAARGAWGSGPPTAVGIHAAPHVPVNLMLRSRPSVLTDDRGATQPRRDVA